MKKLYGVITAMTTPFDTDGNVDVEALRQQTEFLIGQGVNCLYPTGTTGEMYLMTAEQREFVAETVVKTAAGRVTVFIHTGAMTVDEVKRLSLHALKIGADGVGVVTPNYFTVDARAMVTYYKDICSALPLDFPVYTYVIPQLAHNDITKETMQKIADECPNVVGVKYSYPDFRRLCEYREVNDGDFSVVFGADDMFLPALVMGADGTVSGCSGPMPEYFVEVYRNYLAGDLEKARKAQMLANKVVRVLGGGADMSIFKNVLTIRGVTGGHMHKPLCDLTDAQVEALKTAIAPYLN